MEAIRSSETSVLIRATRRHLPEEDNYQHLPHAGFFLGLFFNPEDEGDTFLQNIG
jgi:hypothetical protein